MTDGSPGLPRQGAARTGLRVVGGVLFAAGVVCTAIATIDFFSAMGGGIDRAPTKFWLFFIGLPLLAIGLGCLQGGFLGVGARYAAGELAPAARDALGYVGDGATSSRCPACGEPARADATFCDSCGHVLSSRCPGCGAANDGDARFCSSCGAVLGGSAG